MTERALASGNRLGRGGGAGLVPDALFFAHLAKRRFVAGRFIRASGEEDYIQEQDVMHDVFGHVPLFADGCYVVANECKECPELGR